MKIKMLTSIAGADFALAPNDETERFENAEAVRLIAAGFASPVNNIKPERAVKKQPVETRN